MAWKLKWIAAITALSAAMLGVLGPPTAAAAEKLAPAGAADPFASLEAAGDEVRLSDEESITRWAHAQAKAKVRTSPKASAPALARLRFFTEDRAPEVYVILEARMESRDNTWLRIRVPGRPNGRTGWVLRDSLGEPRVVRKSLTIDRTALRATLFKGGRRIWSARVGVGKSGTPTPQGVFYIRERLRGSAGGAYGPWAFGTSAYSNLSDWPGGGVVGIHGTNQPGLIPGRPSHGCVRVRNASIRRLARLMPLGTPVHVIR